MRATTAKETVWSFNH